MVKFKSAALDWHSALSYSIPNSEIICEHFPKSKIFWDVTWSKFSKFMPWINIPVLWSILASISKRRQGTRCARMMNNVFWWFHIGQTTKSQFSNMPKSKGLDCQITSFVILKHAVALCCSSIYQNSEHWIMWKHQNMKKKKSPFEKFMVLIRTHLIT